MSLSSASRRSSACLLTSLSQLEISSIRPAALQSRHSPWTQRRHASTPRRFRKLLNIAPAPVTPEEQASHVPTGGSGRSRRSRALEPRGDTIVYNPPSSAPNLYHTPALFLPKNDPRRNLAPPEPSIQSRLQAHSPSPADSASTNLTEAPDSGLPPRLSRVEGKKYHLGPAQIEEMRALRQLDEKKWTRGALARKFECSSVFVGMVVQASDDRRQELDAEREARRQFLWGPRRRKARDDRTKRRELWKYE